MNAIRFAGINCNRLHGSLGIVVSRKKPGHFVALSEDGMEQSGMGVGVGDYNPDGHLDIFCAEMHTPGPKEKCTAWMLYGDGQGNFKTQELSVGIGNHESRVADVNGDGKLDIVTKPYTWDTPRLDIWLNQGTRP